MFTYILYVLAILGLVISFWKDKKKTKKALIKAWKAFENILPQLLVILLLIGMLLSVLKPETISRWLGEESGFWGMVIAGAVGSVTLIPGFVAFPLAAALLRSGAGYGQIAMFVTTLMMVGVVTLPAEIQYFGKAIAIRRNLLALVFAIVVAIVMGGIFG